MVLLNRKTIMIYAIFQESWSQAKIFIENLSSFADPFIIMLNWK